MHAKAVETFVLASTGCDLGWLITCGSGLVAHAEAAKPKAQETKSRALDNLTRLNRRYSLKLGNPIIIDFSPKLFGVKISAAPDNVHLH